LYDFPLDDRGKKSVDAMLLCLHSENLQMVQIALRVMTELFRRYPSLIDSQFVIPLSNLLGTATEESGLAPQVTDMILTVVRTQWPIAEIINQSNVGAILGSQNGELVDFLLGYLSDTLSTNPGQASSQASEIVRTGCIFTIEHLLYSRADDWRPLFIFAQLMRYVDSGYPYDARLPKYLVGILENPNRFSSSAIQPSSSQRTAFQISARLAHISMAFAEELCSAGIAATLAHLATDQTHVTRVAGVVHALCRWEACRVPLMDECLLPLSLSVDGVGQIGTRSLETHLKEFFVTSGSMEVEEEEDVFMGSEIEEDENS
jgi:hypothetical protein